MGGVLLALAVLLSSGKREHPPADFMLDSPSNAPSAATAALGGEPAPRQAMDTGRKSEGTTAKATTPETAIAGTAEEAPADSTGEEAPEAEFDEVAARGKAISEVESFNKELATELRTINPNAWKTKLKAAELRQKASDLDDWIKSQDGKAGMTRDERMDWEAQRDVWVGHAKEMRQVAQRLVATHGTKRKVRILAKEISDDLED